MKDIETISKQNPFKVPEDYFAGLTDKLSKVSTGHEQLPEKKSILRNFRPYMLAAASVVIIAVIGYTVYYFSGSLNSRQNSEANSGLYNNIYLNEIDLTTLEENIDRSGNFAEMPEISKNEIIDYLASEEIDIFDIYEQL